MLQLSEGIADDVGFPSASTSPAATPGDRSPAPVAGRCHRLEVAAPLPVEDVEVVRGEQAGDRIELLVAVEVGEGEARDRVRTARWDDRPETPVPDIEVDAE
jgi:hypothetical protein